MPKSWCSSLSIFTAQHKNIYSYNKLLKISALISSLLNCASLFPFDTCHLCACMPLVKSESSNLSISKHLQHRKSLSSYFFFVSFSPEQCCFVSLQHPSQLPSFLSEEKKKQACWRIRLLFTSASIFSDGGMDDAVKMSRPCAPPP